MIMKNYETSRAKAVIAVVILAVLASACAGLGRQGSSAKDPRAFVDAFMRNVVAAKREAAFAALDIEAMVNYGQPQGSLYRSLSLQHQEQYRRDFIGGIYAFLFRDQPPEQALYQLDVPDPAQPVVEVAGRPGKRLRMTVRSMPAGARIVAIEKQ